MEWHIHAKGTKEGTIDFCVSGLSLGIDWMCVDFINGSRLLSGQVLPFTPFLKNQYFQIPIRSEIVDKEAHCECAPRKSLSSHLWLF